MRAKRMILLASILIGAASLFGRVKQTQTNGLIVDLDLRQPTFAFGAHARVAAFVVTAFVTVMRVLKVGRFPQIAETIIRSIAVDMVYLAFWPFTGNVKPSQPMREIKTIVHANNFVPVTHPAPRFFTRRATPAFSRPRENTGVNVIANQIAKAFRRKFVLHGTVNINNWRGRQQ